MNFHDVVHDLDSQNEDLQSQILKLKQDKARAKKQQHERRSKPVSRDGLMSPHIMAQQLRQSTQTQNQELLAQKYIKERAAYQKLAQMPEIVDRLFSDTQDSSIASNLEDYITARDDPTEPAYTKTYASAIQNSLMLLSNMILKQFLVEFNLRKALNDKELLREYPAESYMTENDLLKRLNREERSEIETLLAKIGEDGEEVQISDILEDLGHSEAFSDMALKREDIYHYKSGHWLNYMNSDTTNHIQSELHPRFLSPIVNDEEYISKLKSLFAAYKADSHPFKHANLALEVAKMLANGGKYSPSVSIFRVLLDKFGEIGLYNYQALVHDILPSFDSIEAVPSSERVDADMATQGLYKKLIERDPQYLKSLINYESRKGHFGNLNFLLSYLEPASPNKAAYASNMPLFLKKAAGGKGAFLGTGAIPIDLNIIESALDACIKLGDYERMDRILIKVYAQLALETDTSHKMPEKGSSARLVRELDLQELLTDNVLLTLGETYVRHQDQVRLAWLSPLVSAKIKSNSGGSRAKLATLRDELETLVPMQKSTPRESVAIKKSVVGRSTKALSNTHIHSPQTMKPARPAKSIQINPSKKITPSGLSVSANLGYIDRAVSMAA